MLPAVILCGISVAFDLDDDFIRDRVDYQLAIDCIGNDVLTAAVNGALGALGEFRRISACISALGAYRNVGEISIFRRTGKAGNALLFAAVFPGIGIGRQLYILAVVDVDLMRFLGKRDGRGLIGNQRIAIKGRLICCYRITVFGTRNRLRIRNLFSGAVHVVIDGIIHGLLRVIEGDGIAIRADLQRFLGSIRLVAFNVQGVLSHISAIFATMGCRRMQLFAGFLVYILNGIGERALGVVQIYVFHLVFFGNEGSISGIEGIAFEVTLLACRVEFLARLNSKVLGTQLLIGALFDMMDIDLGHRVDLNHAIKVPSIASANVLVCTRTAILKIPASNIVDVDGAVVLVTLNASKGIDRLGLVLSYILLAD